MKLTSRREQASIPIVAGRRIFFLLTLAVILVPLPSGRYRAQAAVSLTDMARISASERTDAGQALSLIRGYLGLGLRREAADHLERRIHLGEMDAREASVLFDDIVAEQSRWSQPENLAAVCESAIRSGAGTPLVLYSYGNALRLSGRISDASAAFARIPQGSAYYPYALYAIGQSAAEEGNLGTALDVFRRVREITRGQGGMKFLGKRASRSEAELLLLMGRHAEAASLFAGLPGQDDPVARLGRMAAGGEKEAQEIALPEELVAGWPGRERILLFLLQGGLARERRQFAAGVDFLVRAEETLNASLVSTMPSATESFEMYEAAELLSRQIEAHRSLRKTLSSLPSDADPDRVRAGIVELFVGLLFMDHSIARAQGAMPWTTDGSEIPYLSSAQIEEIIGKIERTSLDGIVVDRLVEDLARRLDILQNLAHPIDRYRLLTQLEKSQYEVHQLKERIRERRKAAISGVESAGRSTLSSLLTDVGRFLKELDAIRAAALEIREFSRRHFDILQQRRKVEEVSPEAIRSRVLEALAFDNDRFIALLPSVKALEERDRLIAWERKKLEIRAYRPIVARQMVDALVSHSRFLLREGTPDVRGRAWEALERAASYLPGDRLSPPDRTECAIQIGSLLAEGKGRWEAHPGRTAGEKEKGMTATLLPLLAAGKESRDRSEEAHYLMAVLRFMANDPLAGATAREYLGKFPASPRAGIVALRLGNDALLAGKRSDAAALYRKAAGDANPDASGVGRYMLGWGLFQSGDSENALRELAHPLSDPSFSCEEPSPFEQAVLSLAVRVWRDTSLDRLAAYPPVKEGNCGGRLLLSSLAQEERTRGEAGRAAAVYDVLAQRFADDETSLSYEKRSVEELIRAGKEDQAYARALSLGEKYGPGSPWAKSRPPSAQEKTQEEVAGLLKRLSEKKFDEGLRSGSRSEMSAAKTGMERFFAVREGTLSDENAELRLKWAIASLKTGDRETGVGILKDLVDRRSDGLGEQAAVLYAETMIAGYERKEETAEGAEGSAFLLLEKFPSEKAASLSYRAAAAFLANKEYERSARLAGAVGKLGTLPGRLAHDARLVEAESLLFMNDLEAAREKAESVLRLPPAGGMRDLRDRARDLFVLASLREVEGRTDAGDWNAAARMLEDLGGRFPDSPDSVLYDLRAFRSYRLGGDKESALRVGMSFLEKYPRREEALEIVGAVGPFLVERKEFGKAAGLYADAAGRFPKSAQAPQFLFLAARISREHGDPENAARQFQSYRTKYANPKWMMAYATLSMGLLAREKGETRTALREMEAGLRMMEAGVEQDAPRELFALAGSARIAVGEHWAEQFRGWKLVAPLEKNLSIKDRFFRQALASFEKAKREAPVEEAIQASQRSGDLLVEFGNSILASERPRGLEGEEKGKYEDALKDRARSFFERGLDWYVGALDRLEAEEGPSDLAIPIRERLEKAQSLLAALIAGEEKKKEEGE